MIPQDRVTSPTVNQSTWYMSPPVERNSVRTYQKTDESPQDGQDRQVRSLSWEEPAKNYNNRKCGYAKHGRQPCPLHRRCH